MRLPSNVVLYIANPTQFDRLSPADRTSLMNAAREAQAFGARYVIEQYDRDAETLRQRGVRYYVLSDQELGFLRGAIRPVFERIRQTVGAPGEPVATVLQSFW